MVLTEHEKDKVKRLIQLLVNHNNLHWASTPQGHGYWEDVVQHLVGLVNWRRALGGPTCDENGERVQHLLLTEGETLSMALESAFVWRYSRQGEEYWDNVYNHLERLEVGSGEEAVEEPEVFSEYKEFIV